MEEKRWGGACREIEFMPPRVAQITLLFVFERSARFGHPSTRMQVFGGVTSLARNTEQTRFVHLAP